MTPTTPASSTAPTPAPTISTGVPGLDEILGGGLPEHRLFLVAGDPGTGKTTLALQFLLEAVRRGEPAIYVALSETEVELRDIARSHGWSLDGLTICPLRRDGDPEPDHEYTFFHPSEIELEETTRGFLEVIEQTSPTRVVFDSLSEMRLLTRDSLRFRRQVLRLKSYLASHEITTLLIDLAHVPSPELQLESLVHGVIRLEQQSLQFGDKRRQLLIKKIRGVAFSGGYYDYRIETGGLRAYPRLPNASPEESARGRLKSSVDQLDQLTGGGLDHGTTTLLLGPAGVGKSTLATHYLAASLKAGDGAMVILFEETLANWRARAKGMGIDLDASENAGLLHILELDPAQMFPGELAHRVRCRVEQHGVKTVVLDSLNGYHHAMPEQDFLTLHLHELFTYLNDRGLITLVVAAQHGLVTEEAAAGQKISYLADTVILFRYFEAFGRLRKAISVIKKRTGSHERSIRELVPTSEGLRVGERLEEFQGILAGRLEYLGDGGTLLERPNGRSDV